MWIAEESTAWKVSEYGVISGPYFRVFGLNTEIYSKSQSEYRKIRTRTNSVFGHFSRRVKLRVIKYLILDYLQQKVMTKFSQNLLQTLLFGPFCLFSENYESSQKPKYVTFEPLLLTSCTISREINGQVPRKVHYRRTDGRTDERTNGETQIHWTLPQGYHPKSEWIIPLYFHCSLFFE